MRKKKGVCDHSCFMCRHVLKEWLGNISTKRSVQKVKKGQCFIEEGQLAKGVYFVQEGLVKVHKHWGQKESIVRFASKGDIVGHRGMGSEIETYPISATAMENSVVCFVEFDFFKSLLRTNNNLTYELLMFYADELQVSERKIGGLVHVPVKGRVAWSLVHLSRKFGVDQEGFIAIPLKKTDLAAYIGTTYETVYRVLVDLVTEGMIELQGKKIKVIDHQAVASLVDF